MAKRSPARRSRSATSSSVARHGVAPRPLVAPQQPKPRRRARSDRVRPRTAQRLVLTNTFRFGGLTSALVLRAWEP